MITVISYDRIKKILTVPACQTMKFKLLGLKTVVSMCAFEGSCYYVTIKAFINLIHLVFDTLDATLSHELP